MKERKLTKRKLLILSTSIVTLLILCLTINSISNGSFFTSIVNFLLPYNNGVREKFNFDYGWKFSLGQGTYNSGSDYSKYCLIIDRETCIDAKTNPNSALYEEVTSVMTIPNSDTPYSNEYNTSSWKTVSLPHTYNDEDTFNNFNELGGTGQNGERSTYTGTAWYKKDFFVPANYENKKIYLELEAARQALEIYINGTKLDMIYENGFIPVGFDLTPYLSYDATNTITIMVDNSYPYYVNGTNSKVSWHNSHWHPNYGGLYRNVYLYVVDELHLTLPLYSFIEGQGTYVYATNIAYDETNNTSATINVDAEVENNSIEDKTFTIVSKLIDISGNQIGNEIQSTSLTLAPGAKEVFHMSALFTDLIRWSTDYPYMYTVETEIYEGNTLIDNNSVPLGIRTFRFTNDYGFYLNENYVELNGWGQKSTMEWAGLGAAYPDWMTYYVIELMKEANANYIRWGHVSGSPVQINASDQYGLLVTQPGVDSEGSMSSDTPYDNNSLKLRIEAFRDMIIYFRNNPSIIMWELGNSATVTNVNLSQEYIDSIKGLQYSKASGSVSVIEILYSLVEQYDYGNRSDDDSNAGFHASSYTSNDRLTTVRQGNSAISSYIDVTESTLGGAILSGKPIVESEYNRLESRRGLWDTYTFPTFVGGDYYKTSEEYAVSQMKNTTSNNNGSKITSQSYILNATNNTGGANWIFSDSISHGRVADEVSRVSGEVDAVMLPKEAYYVNQVIFSKNPSIHIIGHWNYTAGTVKNVFVAARHVSMVSLYVGQTEYIGALSDNYLWTFNDVAWENEAIRVEGKDSNGNVLVTDSITPHGVPNSIKLTAITNPTGIKATGSDIVLIDAEVIDASGNRCITFDGETLNDLTTFAVNDPDDAVIWRGGYNSGIENSINSESLYLEAGINRVALKTTMNSGTFTITATNSSGLTSNTLSLNSTSVTQYDQNGLSDLMNATESYNLTSLTDPGVGDGSILGNVPATHQVTNASVYISNFNYTGSVFQNNTIVGVLTPGTKLYSDINDTATVIPYELLNAEFLRLPNIDCSQMAIDLLTFETKKDVDIFVFRDSSYTGSLPSWMNSYTKTDDQIISSGGIYDIYKKSVPAITFETFGGNFPSIVQSCNSLNYIIAIKPTETVANVSTFFKENFTNFDSDSLYSMWNTYTPMVGVNESTVIVEDNGVEHGNVLHLSDTNNLLTSIQKQFSGLSNFKFKFDIYMDNSIQDWVNIWLSDGLIELDNAGEEIKDNLSIESYLKNTGSNLILKSRAFVNSNPGENVNNVFSTISIDNWHTYEYDIELTNRRFRIKIDNGEYSSWQKTYPNINVVNTIMFGSHLSGVSNYLIDNIEIIPTITDVISNVRVNSEELLSFSSNAFNYYIPNIDENTTISFDTNEYYQLSSISYDSTSKTKSLNVVDVQGNSKTYNFIDQSQSTLLDGWGITAPTDTLVEITRVDGQDTIHFVDNTTNEMAYISKTFPSITGEFSISWSSKITNLAENKHLRVWTLDGNMTSTDNKTNVLIAGYMHRDANSLQFINEHTLSGLSGTSYTFSVNANLNVWNNYELIVDTVNHSYDLYINETLEKENLKFLVDLDHADTLVIGTGKSTKSDVYIKNIEVSQIFENPITNIVIDSINLTGFNKEIFEYNFYTTEELTDATPITVLYNATDYESHTISRNLITQTATIEIISKANTLYTYTINFLHPSLLPVTVQELQEKIDYVKNNLNSNNYTNTSWQRLENYVIIAENLLDQTTPEPSLVSATYYHINLEIEKLMQILNYPGNGIALISNTKYSSDLENVLSYDTILDNDISIYSDVNSPTFRSIPMKYMNAGYFKLENTIYSEDGEISFTANRPIDIIILRDIKSGAVTRVTYDENGNPIYYEDTGDIATSSDGTVYKIYKKHYNTGAHIVVPISILINNHITNKNHIVAIKDSSNVENNRFFYENIDLYDENTLKLAWGAYEPDDSNSVELVDKEDNQVVSKAIHVVSNSINNAPILYREFAKMYNKFNVSYRIFLSNPPFNSTDLWVNRFTRVWIINDSLKAKDTNGKGWRESFDNSLKNKVCVLEAYIDNNSNLSSATNWKFLYRKDGFDINYNVFNFYRGEWVDISLNLNMNTDTFEATMTRSGNVVSSGSGTLYSTFDYADFLQFAGRKTGLSDFWIKEARITPINNGYLENITVNTLEGTQTNVNNFISTTKDYLYRASSIDDLTVNTTAGAVNSTITTNDVFNSSKLLYTNVDVSVDDVVKENHRIYYEVQSDRRELTALIERAYLLSESNYTETSWNSLLETLSLAVELLSDNTATQTEIDEMTSALNDKIDDLIVINVINMYYTGFLYAGNTLKNNATQTLNITNKSSFTFEATLNKNVGNNYAYEYAVHDRRIVSNSVLPAGTKISMLDMSSTSNPSYYYYIVTQTDVTSNKKIYPLSSFTKMGTSINYINGTYYSNLTGFINIDLKFIVDFKDCLVPLADDTYSIRLEDNVSGNIVTMDNMFYMLHDDSDGTRAMSVSFGEESYHNTEPIHMNIVSSYTPIVHGDETIIDTIIEDKKIGVKISLLKNDININLPIGTVISFENGASCTIVNNKCSLTFGSYNNSIDENVIINFGKYGLLEPGDYVIKIEYILSENGINLGTSIGVTEENIIITEKPLVSFRVSLDPLHNNILQSGLSRSIKYNINKENINSGEVIVYLQEKADNLYSTVNLNSYVYNTLTEYETDKYNLGNISNWTANFNSLLPHGSYRLVFNLIENNEVINTEYEYIVVK